MSDSLLRRCAAEAFGTFFLVFAGTGAIVFNTLSNGAITHVGIALTFGLVVTILIYAIGSVSGAHMNPAVTLGLTVAGQFRSRELPAYWLSQLLAAFLASGLHFVMSASDVSTNLGATLPARVLNSRQGYGPIPMVWQSFVLEIILTLVLMYTVLSVCAAKPEVQSLGGIIVGCVIALEALFAGPICGASMNPARSLAPAVVSGQLEHLWIYLSAPLIGAVLAVRLWNFINTPETPRKDDAPR